MKRFTKKAFTLVELLVVIAILAVLATVSVVGYNSFTKKATISNDNGFIAQLNAYVAAYTADGTDIKTVNEIDEELEQFDFSNKQFNPTTKGYHYGFDISKDKFVLIDDTNKLVDSDSNKIDVFALVNGDSDAKSMMDEGYSLYLQSTNYTSTLLDHINTGVDVGNNTDIASITYSNSDSKQDVVIRTNGGTLSVNGAKDTVKHYGDLKEATITAVSSNSYYEYGKVTFVDIANGRLVIANTEEAKVDTIYLTATSDAYNGIILATMNGAELPAVVQRQEVSAGEKLVVTIQTNVNDEGKNPTSTEEIWMRAQQDVEKGKTGDGYTDVSKLGQLVLEAPDGTASAGKAYTESKVATKDKSKSGAQARAIQVDKNTYELATKEDLFLFASLVNGGQTFAGMTVKLVADIDLNNEAWTPIGTSAHPFDGKFDGQNHTISNLNVNVVEMGGLFGYINGNPNPNYNVTSDIWNFENNTFSEANIAESYYTAVAKNVNLANVNVVCNTSDKKHIGGFCAMAGYAYFENINVYSGSVTGYKVVGGIFGAAYGCAVKKCSTGSGLTVEANSYHAGGIIGATNTATAAFSLTVVGCTNNAAIISNGNGSGYAGGIIGDANNTHRKAIVVYNCVNNGTITASGDHVAGIVGNMGVQAGESTPVIAKCTNNGNITTKESQTLKNVGGIESNAAGLVYNCTNYGDISGAVTVSAAGIVGSTYQTTVTINGCVNFGDLSGVTGVTPSDAVSGVQNVITLENQTYANVAALQEAIGTATGTVVLKNLTVTDKSGTLVLPSNVFDVVADKQYFAGLDISNCDRDYITITIPNFEYTLHGDASSKTLGLSGVNNKTTFAADCKLDWLRNYGSNDTYVKVDGCVVNTIHGATEAK